MRLNSTTFLGAQLMTKWYLYGVTSLLDSFKFSYLNQLA